MKPTKRKSAVSGNLLDSKRSRVDPAPARLPPEIWEMIFLYLSAYWLKSARLTCQTWNQIIHGSSRLMDKFVLTLAKVHFVEDRQRVRDTLASGEGITRATIDISNIGKHKPRFNWFVPLGSTLHTLSLKLTGTVVMLGQILKEMPNLKNLHVNMHNQLNISNVPSFQLAKLETLSIRSITSADELMRFFRQICPRLAELNVRMKFPNMNDRYDHELTAFAFEVRKTLKVLKTEINDEILNELIAMEDLRLTGANIYGSPEQCLRFIRCQSTLESLDITQERITVEQFNEIFTALPNLTNLQVSIKEFHTQPSLAVHTSSKLETLRVEYAQTGSRFKLDLGFCCLPNLRNLRLYRCILSNQALESLQKSQITNLTLYGCDIQRLANLRLLKSLETVQVGYNYIEDLAIPDPTDDENQSRVSSLKVTRSNDAVVLACINLFRNLYRFEAGIGVDLTKTFLEELLYHSPQLKELRVIGYEFPPNALREAVRRLRSLEMLYVTCHADKRDQIVEGLRNVRGNVGVTVKGCSYEEFCRF